MRKMSGPWESLTRSRMATLAVNALLLSAGSTSCCASPAASAAPSWSGPGTNMMRHFTHLRHHTATSSSTASAALRHSDETGNGHECGSKRPSGEELRKRSRHRGRQSATPSRTSTQQNMHDRRIGWARVERERLWHAVSGVRAAAASATRERESGGTKRGADVGGSEQPRERRMGWMKRLQSRAYSDSDGSVRQRQQQQEGSLNAGTAAIMNAGIRTPPVATESSSADAAAAVAMNPPATAAIAPPSPVPSYLQWARKAKAAAEPKQQGDGDDDEGDRRRSDKNALSLGVGSRTGRSGTSGEATTLGTAKASRGGGGASAAVSLTFTEAMFAGAVSRSIAQTCMQPANVVKTLLQGRGTASQLSNLSLKLLTRGAGAQFVMSLPHGAFNYATLEVILGCSAKIFPDEWRERAGPVLDFLSSSVATVVCSVVSTPQMVLTDRIMAGIYPNLVSGVREISRTQGLKGFYTGWSANVAQKIPSYGLTWVFFQQFKRLHRKATDRPPTNTENFVLGAAAAGATVCIMIPMDTVKTRLVTQTAQAGVVPYKGVLRTLSRIVKEEGLGPIYRSLTPRLVSVVPMIGIQFGIYEFVRKELMSRKDEGHKPRNWLPPVVKRTLRIGVDPGSVQPDFFKDFLRKVYLMEEQLV